MNSSVINHLSDSSESHEHIILSERAFKWLFFFGAIAAGGIFGALIVYGSPLFAFWLLLGGISVLFFFYNAEYGLLAMLFIAYTYTSNVLIYNYGLPSIMKPLTVFLIVVIVFRWVFLKEKPTGWLRSALAISGYGLIGLVSFFYATDIYIVREWLVAFAKDAIIAVIIAILFQRLVTLRRIIWVLLWAGIFMGTLTTIQQLTGSYNSTYFGFSKVVLAQIVGEADNWRSVGPLYGPNDFAQAMLIVIPLAIERMWNEKKMILRFLAGWALTVSTLAIFYTYSRSAFVGLMVVVAVMFIYRRVKLTNLLLTGFLFFAILFSMPSQYTARILTLTDFLPGSDTVNTTETSFRGRFSENLTAWRMFMDHPILGVGLHNYPVNYQRYSRELGLDSRREERNPHNLYLEIASEMGLVGLFWFGSLLWVAFKGVYEAREKLKEIDLREYDGQIMAFAVSIVGFLITSLYQHMVYPRYFWIIFGIVLAFKDVIRQEEEAYELVNRHGKSFT